MNDYFRRLNILPDSKVIRDMRRFAADNQVPVINDEGLVLMLELVDLIKPKRFLEIGTAIGFCAVNMATYDAHVTIDTIEKNPDMVRKAEKYIREAKLETRIRIHTGDALELDPALLTPPYDMIFIDAAKAQYLRFFEKYHLFLSAEGIIITDNLLFHGLVCQDGEIDSKNLRHLVTKIREFNQWLSENQNFKTRFFAIGDGMAVSRKVNP